MTIAILRNCARFSAELVLIVLLFAAAAARAEPARTESLKTLGADETDGGASPFLLNYTNILYGPSIGNPASFQPLSDGTLDRTRPIFMKNFLTAAYNLDERWSVAATAYWWYQPVLGQQLSMMDPFVRLSNASVISTPWGLNLYSDVRIHPGVSSDSRAARELVGFQNFSYLTYQPDYGRFTFALRASARYNYIQNHGYGSDAEFYLAPEVDIRTAPKWAFTLLYEMGASHQFGDKASYYTNDGTDLEPGVEWDPTPDMVVNPYLILQTGGKVNFSSTAMGMFFTWTFL